MDTRVLKTLARRRQATAQARLKRRQVAVPLAVPKDVTATPRTGPTFPPGAVSYWKLDEASGTRVDSVGTNHLTPTNAPVGAAGKIGNGCDFESTSSQYLSHADPTPLGDADWTYSVWFKRESVGAYHMLITKGPSAYGLYVADHGGITFYIGDSSLGQVGAPVGIANDTNWHLVIAWHDAVGNTIHLQVDNGTDLSNATTGPVPLAPLEPVQLAGRYDGNYFDGLIDEVALWRRVLTAQERTDLYNGGAGLEFSTSGLHPEDVILTDDDRDLFTPHVIQIEGEVMPFRVRVDPYYYFEHVTENASGVWIYAPTR